MATRVRRRWGRRNQPVAPGITTCMVPPMSSGPDASGSGDHLPEQQPAPDIDQRPSWWHRHRDELGRDAVVSLFVGLVLLAGAVYWDSRLVDRQNSLTRELTEGQNRLSRELAGTQDHLARDLADRQDRLAREQADRAEAVENLRFVRQLVVEGAPVKPLASLNLKNADLSALDLSCTTNRCRTNLTRTNLRGAVLIETDLRGAELDDADLCGSNVNETDLRQASLDRANLTNASLAYADLRGADLGDANLTGADLSGAEVHDTGIDGANLSGADLTGVDLTEFRRLQQSQLEVAANGDRTSRLPKGLHHPAHWLGEPRWVDTQTGQLRGTEDEPRPCP